MDERHEWTAPDTSAHPGLTGRGHGLGVGLPSEWHGWSPTDKTGGEGCRPNLYAWTPEWAGPLDKRRRGRGPCRPGGSRGAGGAGWAAGGRAA